MSATKDGRNLRAERTRAAILGACRVLIYEGNLRPKVGAIADRADVSVRSVFQHFGDLLALYDEAIKNPDVVKSVTARFIDLSDAELTHYMVIGELPFRP